MDYDPADRYENDDEFVPVCDNPDCIIMEEHRRSECYTAVEAELMASPNPW